MDCPGNAAKMTMSKSSVVTLFVAPNHLTSKKKKVLLKAEMLRHMPYIKPTPVKSLVTHGFLCTFQCCSGGPHYLVSSGGHRAPQNVAHQQGGLDPPQNIRALLDCILRAGHRVSLISRQRIVDSGLESLSTW